MVDHTCRAATVARPPSPATAPPSESEMLEPRSPDAGRPRPAPRASASASTDLAEAAARVEERALARRAPAQGPRARCARAIAPRHARRACSPESSGRLDPPDLPGVREVEALAERWARARPAAPPRRCPSSDGAAGAAPRRAARRPPCRAAGAAPGRAGAAGRRSSVRRAGCARGGAAPAGRRPEGPAAEPGSAARWWGAGGGCPGRRAPRPPRGWRPRPPTTGARSSSVTRCPAAAARWAAPRPGRPGAQHQQVAARRAQLRATEDVSGVRVTA